MTTHDRHAEDVPTLTEVGPRARATDERWEQTEWAPPDDDRSAAHREPDHPDADERLVDDGREPDRDYANPVATGQDDTASADPADASRPEAESQHASGRPSEPAPDTALFADDELAGLRARWDTVQAGFVDDPKECVKRADGLVSDVVGQLTSGFTDARSRLESQWARGEEATTEDLRVALKRYRDFFDRLLAV